MGQTNHPDDLLARIARLERDLAEVRKRSGVGNAVSRGTFQFVDAAGVGRVYFGPTVPYGLTGFAFSREDSTNALTLEGAPGAQFVALRDRSTNIIVSDDTSGQGLATPYIQYMATESSKIVTPTVTTSSASFAELWRIHGQKQHPKIKVQLLIQSDAGTTGTVQLAEGASTVIVTDAIAAADNSYHVLEGPVTGAYMADLFVRVEAKRTGGAGAIRMTVTYAEGKQS